VALAGSFPSLPAWNVAPARTRAAGVAHWPRASGPGGFDELDLPMWSSAGWLTLPRLVPDKLVVITRAMASWLARALLP
jgi:hypothetical protein